MSQLTGIYPSTHVTEIMLEGGFMMQVFGKRAEVLKEASNGSGDYNGFAHFKAVRRDPRNNMPTGTMDMSFRKEAILSIGPDNEFEYPKPPQELGDQARQIDGPIKTDADKTVHVGTNSKH